MTNQNSDASNTPAVTTGEHLGRVKWFNSKLGYGFITTNLNSEDHDIFIHQSNIHPTQSRYRTLREGEYVSLNVSESGETRQAIDVTGVNGGPLNCDLERNMRNTRRPHNESESNEDEEFTKVQPRGRRPRPRPSP
jgi:cold shock protein